MRKGVFVGLAIACAALTACEGAAPADRTIELDIHHSRFSPQWIAVEAGTTVRFVVENGDPIAHELIVGDEDTQRIHEKGTEAHHGARDGEVSVRALSVAETTYTFEEPGALIFGCHLPGHYAYGMRGTIEIR